jgi:hypothetical protein
MKQLEDLGEEGIVGFESCDVGAFGYFEIGYFETLDENPDACPFADLEKEVDV